MRYTVEDTVKVGKPARVFDADGNELDGCTMVDTDTGEVERIKVDADGNFVVHPNGKRLVCETVVVPGVRVEFKQ